MILAGPLRAQHRRLLDACQATLDDLGWQGFIEPSDHPAHDLRLVLEEVIVLGSAIDALASFIEAGPGGAHEQVNSLATQADVVIVAAHARVALVSDPGVVTLLDEHLRALSESVRVAALDYRQRPADERHSLADALFGS